MMSAERGKTAEEARGSLSSRARDINSQLYVIIDLYSRAKLLHEVWALFQNQDALADIVEPLAQRLLTDISLLGASLDDLKKFALDALARSRRVTKLRP